MTNLNVIVAGIVATAVMTIFTELFFPLLKRNYHVVRILANMIRLQPVTPMNEKPQPQMIVAGVVHYAIGILFAFLYRSFVMWVPDWSPSLQAFVFGILIAVVAIGGWRLFFDLHPGPPPVSLTDYLGVIAIGHLLLSFTLAGIQHLASN